MEVEKEDTSIECPLDATTMLNAGNKLKKNLRLSPAEQILAGTTQHPPTFYPTESESLLNPYLCPSSDISTISRSMTALGLSNTIPEEPSGLDFENSALLQNAGRIASKSAIDLVGLNEDEVICERAAGGETEKTLGGLLDHQQSSTATTPTAGKGGLDSGFSFQITPLPSRCILISNLSPLLTDDNLRLLIQNFGDVQSFRSEYRVQGIVQVSYYDIRSATTARDQLSGLNVAEQCLNVQYALTPGSVGSYSDSTLLVFNIDPHWEPQQVAASFLAYGDVRRVQSIPEKKDYRLVEFYDIRHCLAAMNALNQQSNPSSSRDLSMKTAGMKQTMSLHNLMMNESQEVAEERENEDEDQASRSWDGSAHAIQQMETLMAMDLSNNSEQTNILMQSTQQSGMTKSISFGSGLGDLNSTNPAAQSPTTLRSGAVQLTPQLAEGLKLSDSASSLNPMHGLGSTPSPIGPQTLKPQPTASSFGNQNVFNRSNMSYSNSVGTGLDTYGQQQQGLGVNVPPLWDAVLQQGGNLGLNLNPGLNSFQNSGAGNFFQTNPTPGGGLLGNLPNQNANGNVMQTLAVAQAAAQATGLSVSDILSKISTSNLSQLLTNPSANTSGDSLQQSLQQNPYSLLNNLGNTSGSPSLSNAGMPALQSSLSPSLFRTSLNTNNYNLGGGGGNANSSGGGGGGGLDLGGTMSKSASSPALHVGNEDRDSTIPRSGGRLSRRNVDPLIEAERRAQQQRLYALDLEKIKNKEDKRTTLMIKNIPNKYTQKMLLASIDETLKGTYDFFYLPIDFKNKCNVGYGFINMRNPDDIIPLVERFHNKKWERFNSEKVCCVAYGRIQGKQALINHFQNSSLMHEDKKHRPVLFVTEGPNKGEPEQFPVGTNVRPKISFKERDFRSRERSGHWA